MMNVHVVGLLGDAKRGRDVRMIQIIVMMTLVLQDPRTGF